MTRFLTLSAALALAAGGAAATPGANFLAQWDADGDGAVTRAEADDRRIAIFESFDADADGALSAAELALMAEHRAQMAEDGHGPGQGEGQGRRWQQAMRDGQGRGMAHGQGQGARMAGAGHGAGGIIGLLDDDGDGAIQRAEFLAATDAWFSRRDRTGDGVITADDFGR
jgi:hypothetical protein